MIIDIPRQFPFSQSNQGDFLGSIWSTRNVDFEKDRGKFLPSPRVVPIVDSVSDAELTEVATAFAYENGLIGSISSNRFWALVDNYLFQGGGMWGMSRDDSSTGVPMSTAINQEESDMTAFNGNLYIAGGKKLYKRTSTTYSEIGSDSLSNNLHLLVPYSDRLYIRHDDTTIGSMNTAGVYVTTGDYTIDLGEASSSDLYITCMRAVNNGIWIGTYNNAGGRAKMYFWDGVTQNVATSYKVDAVAILSMTIKDNVPYIMTDEGRLMTFNGSFFYEVARIPVKDNLLYRYGVFSYNDRWIHPNGMIVVKDQIYMAINTRTGADNDPQDQDPRLPSGIWCYDENIGLYHKYSLSSSIENDTNRGNYKDYGQIELAQIGGMYPLLKQTDDDDYQDQSEFFVGYSFKTNTSTEVFAIGVMDLSQDYHSVGVPNAGVIVLNKIQSEEAVEMWEKIWLHVKPPENSTDKIVVKYRTQEYTPVESNITWVNTTSFTTTDTDWATIKTNFDAGVDYEIEVLQGDGAGMNSHITALTVNAGTYTVTLDETHIGVTTNTAKVRADRWIKIGEFTDSTESATYKDFPITKASTWIQYKIFMLGQHGNPKVERIISQSSKFESV